MTRHKYRTLLAPSTGEIKEKSSRFLGFAYPAKDEDEVKIILESLRKKYYDARHHCFAYCIGSNHEKTRANDAGEPKHSAGDPILGQIRARNLTNVLVVVVRYFGGTKLGVGRLIAAYRTAASLTLDEAELVNRDVMVEVVIRYEYSDTAEVMRIIGEFGLQIINQSFEENCSLRGLLKLEKKEIFYERFRVMKMLNTTVEILE